MKSLAGQIRITFDKGLDRLIAVTAWQTPVLTGFKFATISSGQSRSACCPILLNPLKLPTTSNSGRSRKRYSIS